MRRRRTDETTHLLRVANHLSTALQRVPVFSVSLSLGILFCYALSAASSPVHPSRTSETTTTDVRRRGAGAGARDSRGPWTSSTVQPHVYAIDTVLRPSVDDRKVLTHLGHTATCASLREFLRGTA